jgi:hypothetical protein
MRRSIIRNHLGLVSTSLLCRPPRQDGLADKRKGLRDKSNRKDAGTRSVPIWVQASDPRKSSVRIPFKEFVRKDPSEVSFCFLFYFFGWRSERFDQ